MALVVSQVTLLDWLAAHACEPTPEPATALDGLTRTEGGTTYTLPPWHGTGEPRRSWQTGTRTGPAVVLWPQYGGWGGCCYGMPWRRADLLVEGDLRWLGHHDTREAAEAAADAALRERLALALAPLARTNDTRQETP